MPDLTRLLDAAADGDRHAAADLLPLVYDELRKLAAAKLATEKPGQTLQGTALVHEAYVRLVGGAAGDPGWDSRGHFFGAAAEAMRRILVENARWRQTEKHGGGRERVDLAAIDPAAEGTGVDLLDLDEALEKLARCAPRKADLVKLRFFAGLTLDEAAAALNIAPSTADEDWAFARAWLRVEIADRPAGN